MEFSKAVRKQTHLTKTENGAIALNTTDNKCLDFFSTIGALRKADSVRIQRLFDEAYSEDKLLATKILFYGRDIRGGSKVGERRVFRILLKHIATYHPEALIKNISLIGFYGRWDDLYALVDTPLESEMWSVMKKQFEEDIENMNAGKSVSLLAKWVKTADASSPQTRKMGINTALKMGYTVYDYKRKTKALRKYIDVVERKMSAQKWSEIIYSNVPSRAMMNYRNAFINHDRERFEQFTNKAVIGEEKINSSTLYPYDIIEKIGIPDFYFRRSLDENEKKLLEAQWRQLPNYVEEDTNAIVMADTSGSMFGRPICTSLGLAIYFAQRNKGAFHNLWMSFSREPKFHEIKGETLEQIIENIDTRDWDMNTNLELAFELVLNTAIKNNCTQEEMPKSIIVISDMEIDCCTNSEWIFYDTMKSRFASFGYEIPNIVFWNVESRRDTYHADSKRKGVQLVSGQSVGTFSLVMKTINMTPIECMMSAINDERYSFITI